MNHHPKRSVAIQAAVSMLCVAGWLAPAQAADENVDHRQEMRDFIATIAGVARAVAPDFIVVTQNGLDLMTTDGDPEGSLATDYTSVLNGVSQEGVSFGFDDYCSLTPRSQHREALKFLDRARDGGLAVLLTDYCDRPPAVARAGEIAAEHGFISFVSRDDDFGLSSVPEAPARPSNPGNVTALLEGQNYLYLLNPENFDAAGDLVGSAADSDFDIIVIEPFFRSDEPFTASEVARLQRKATGDRRLVLAYLNVGAVENWRYYWQVDWQSDDPDWIGETYSDDYPDEFWARYWRPEWHDIIYRADDSFLNRILAQGFDGVFLDNIDAYEIFED